jgi:hypothetical protein
MLYFCLQRGGFKLALYDAFYAHMVLQMSLVDWVKNLVM